MSDTPSEKPPVLQESATAWEDNEIELGETVRHFAHRLLKCNPFYLASAVLLLFGIAKISTSGDISNQTRLLWFNFGSLHGYELLMVGTAIVLARRGVVYDSMLLVFLENLFAMVPFLLVSEAALLSPSLGLTVALLGILLVGGRAYSLQRFYPRLNLPRSFLICGGVLVLVNALGPLYLGWLQTTRPGNAAGLVSYGWLVVLPVLVLLSKFLRLELDNNRPMPERGYWPWLWYVIGLGVTMIHIWRIGIVYDAHWTDWYLAIPAWVATWTMYHRCYKNPSAWAKAIEPALVWTPLVASLIAAEAPRSELWLALSVANAVIFLWLYQRQRNRQLYLELFGISLALAAMAIPMFIWQAIVAIESRGECVWIIGGLYLLLRTCGNKDPRLALIGGVVVFAATLSLVGGPTCGYFACQNASVFILIHSLRWNDSEHDGTTVLRWSANVFWVFSTLVWQINRGFYDAWPSMTYSGALLGICAVRHFVLGQPVPAAVPVGAAMVFLVAPGHVFVRALMNRATKIELPRLSTGMWMLVGSLLLFALGTILATTRKTWETWLTRKRHAPSSPTGTLEKK